MLTRVPYSLAQNILDVLDAFSGYFASLTHILTPTSRDSDVFTAMVRYQRQLLMHVAALYPSFELLIQEDGRPSPRLFQQLHRALNSNIELLSCHKTVTPRLAEDNLLLECRDSLISIMEALLLSEGFQWISLLDDLCRTARLAYVVCPANQRLLQGIIYRYFLFLIPPPPTPRFFPGRTNDPRRERAHLQGRAFAPLFTSVLQLCVWLHPRTVGPEAQWSIFDDFLRFVLGLPSSKAAACPLDPETMTALVTMARESENCHRK